MTFTYLYSGFCRQVGGDTLFSPALIAGLRAEEAVQQPQRVEQVNHKHPEQQLCDRALFIAAVGGFGVTGRKHDYQVKKKKMCPDG